MCPSVCSACISRNGQCVIAPWCSLSFASHDSRFGPFRNNCGWHPAGLDWVLIKASIRIDASVLPLRKNRNVRERSRNVHHGHREAQRQVLSALTPSASFSLERNMNFWHPLTTRLGGTCTPTLFLWRKPLPPSILWHLISCTQSDTLEGNAKKETGPVGGEFDLGQERKCG